MSRQRLTPEAAVEGADHAHEHCRTCGAPISTADFFCSRECWEAEAAYDGFDDLDEDGEVPELDFDE